MNEQDVVALMSSSVSENDWNNKCEQVKRACGGYPGFWYRAVILSGLMARTAKGWKQAGQPSRWA